MGFGANYLTSCILLWWRFFRRTYNSNLNELNARNALNELDPAVSAWTIGPYLYSLPLGAVGASIAVEDQGLFFVLSNSTELEPDKGDYSGSSISVTLTLPLESGDFSVTDGEGLNAAIVNGTKAAVISAVVEALEVVTDLNGFPVTVQPDVSTRWVSLSTVGTVSVTVGDDGDFVITTTEPLYLTKSLVFGAGIVGAPDTVEFNMRYVRTFLE